MNRVLLVTAALVLTTGITAERATAQPPIPGGAAGAGSIQRPRFSPYLNLLRPGGSPALNYYGLVRPEQQFRQSIGSLQGSVAANQQAISGLQSGLEGPPATGHSTQFLNYSGYFLNSGSGAAGGMGSRPSGTAGGVMAGQRAVGGGVGLGGGNTGPRPR
jgi:hypothetical protein